MRIDFGIRDTPRGCVAWKKTAKHEREKRFRNGYASARSSAKKWIHEQVEAIREVVLIDGLAKPEIYVDGEQVEL